MERSKLVAEVAKEWQQLVSKIHEAYPITNAIPCSVNRVREKDMAISPEETRNSWAKKFKKWIVIFPELRRTHKDIETFTSLNRWVFDHSSRYLEIVSYNNNKDFKTTRKLR